MSRNYQQEEVHSHQLCESKEGTMIDLLKVACEELYPKFIEAGASRCAYYVSTFLVGRVLLKHLKEDHPARH